MEQMLIIAGGILIPVCVGGLFWFGLLLWARAMETSTRPKQGFNLDDPAQLYGVVLMVAAVGLAGFVIAYPIFFAASVP